MDFIKKHLLIVISAAVSVLALVILVLGISRVSGAKEVLNQAQQQMDRVIDILKGVLVIGPDGRSTNMIPTEKVVEDMRKLEVVFKEQGYQTLQKALEQNVGYDPVKKTLEKRQPLMEGIFPKPASDDRPFKFPQVYKEALNGLLARMKAGGLPTAKEIADEKELASQEQGLMPVNVDKPKSRLTHEVAPRDIGMAPPGPGFGPIAPGMGPAMRPGVGLGTGSGNYGDQDKSGLNVQAALKAAAKNAAKIKVYCDSIQSLDVIPEVYTLQSGTPPGVENMWWAQLSYWIQKDIVEAIFQANSQAKDVMESTVKRVLGIKVMHGYLVSSEEGKTGFVGRDEMQGPDNFANLGSDKYYDVVRFQLDLIVDARKIPLLIDAMYKQSHYLLYMWNIEAFTPPTAQSSASDSVTQDQLFVYGNVPLVRLTTWWEGYLFRDFYHWGIVGYGIDKETGKSFLLLYNGKKQELEDIEQRTGLEGLMPKTIRQALGSESEDSSAEGSNGRIR
jgi:hypothetical protein